MSVTAPRMFLAHANIEIHIISWWVLKSAHSEISKGIKIPRKKVMIWKPRDIFIKQTKKLVGHFILMKNTYYSIIISSSLMIKYCIIVLCWLFWHLKVGAKVLWSRIGSLSGHGAVFVNWGAHAHGCLPLLHASAVTLLLSNMAVLWKKEKCWIVLLYLGKNSRHG